MFLRETMATEVMLQPRTMHDGNGDFMLESLHSELISSLSVSEFKGNRSCKSGKGVLDWTSPLVARGGGRRCNAVPSLRSCATVRTDPVTSIPGLVIMNSLLQQPKSKVITAPKIPTKSQSTFSCHTHTPARVSADYTHVTVTVSLVVHYSTGETNISTITPLPSSN